MGSALALNSASGAVSWSAQRIGVEPRRARAGYHRAREPGGLPPGVGSNAWLGLVIFGEYHCWMDLQLTAVFRKVPEGYIGFVEELPGANTQGATLEEARANLHEAVEMVLQANRELVEEASTGAEVIREPFKVSA